VHATEAVVRERCADRARVTGRHVPEELIIASLKDPKESLALLTPQCDFIARIDNSGNEPFLEAVETIDTSGCWNSISNRFARLEASIQEFPLALAPLALQPAERLKGALRIHTKGPQKKDQETKAKRRGSLAVFGAATSPVTHLTLDMEAVTASAPLSCAAYENLFQQGVPRDELELIASPMHPVSLTPEARLDLGVDPTAFSCAWIYNCAHEWLENSESSDQPRSSVLQHTPSYLPNDKRRGSRSTLSQDKEMEMKKALSKAGYQGEYKYRRDELTSLLRYGGFVYFDELGNVVDVNVPRIGQARAALVEVQATHHRMALLFGPREEIPPEAAQTLWDEGRWRPKPSYLHSEDVCYYCWVCPGEVVAGNVLTKSGAFAYLDENTMSAFLFPLTCGA